MSRSNDNSVVIYHNARCSKSRAACELVAGQGIDAQIVDYLKTPPSREQLRALLKKLGLKPSDIVRQKEEIFKEYYAGQSLDDEQWLDALVEHPILIERPIVVCGDRAVIGRPTEKVLELFEGENQHIL